MAKDLLGIPFLAYVTNVSEEQIRARVERELKNLEEPAESAFAATLERASEWAAPPRPDAPQARPDGTPADRMRRFGWFDMDEGESLANLVRRSVGGDLPEPPEALDPVERAVAEAAIDYYPLTLLPPPHPDHPFQGYPVTAHSRADIFGSAVIADNLLMKLFRPAGVVYTSSGFGYSRVDPTRLLGCILANAEQWVRAFEVREPSAYVDAGIQGLWISRELCEKGIALVPTLVGFSNVQVPKGMNLPGPRDGRLRAARDTDLRIPGAAPPTMVLETESTLAMHVGPPPLSGPFWDGWKQINFDEELIALGGLLAISRGDERALPVVTWRKVFDPLSPFTGSFVPERVRGVPFELLAEDLNQLQDWIARLEKHFHPSVRVAIKRCLSAFAERSKADDALIDLVIAMENLFGAKEGELRFRISTAMAWLLGSDAEDRVRVQREVRAVYDARSKIVHGGELAEDESSENQRRAERLLLGALVALFTRRPDLISDPERAGRLILDK